jgi:hypothetical protein
MADATDNRNSAGEGAGLSFANVAQEWNGPIAANVKILNGTLAGVLNSDTSTNNPGLKSFVGDGTMTIRGFVTLGADNTGGAKGALPIRVRAQVGALTDKNAGGGSAIGIADLYKPAYGADNQTVSKLASDGTCIGMIVGIDPSGQIMTLASPLVAKLVQELASVGTAFTQTYSTADTTVPAVTTHAITDSSGGAASTTTLAAVTNAANAGSADVGPVKNNFATLAAEQALVKADVLENRKLINGLIDALQAAGIVG